MKRFAAPVFSVLMAAVVLIFLNIVLLGRDMKEALIHTCIIAPVVILSTYFNPFTKKKRKGATTDEPDKNSFE